jgi:hypothetical protein
MNVPVAQAVTYCRYDSELFLARTAVKLSVRTALYCAWAFREYTSELCCRLAAFSLQVAPSN